jgi:serine/threonine protein kinase
MHKTFGILVSVFFGMLTGDYPFQTKESVLNDQLPDMNEVRLNKQEEFKISDESYQIVTKLLNKDHKQRLASVDIKMEPFYKDFDWIKLENGSMEPPIKPKLVIIINSLKTF